MLALRNCETLSVIVFLFVGFSSCVAPGSNTGDHELYPVIKVVDGDTFWIDDGSEKGVKVRLIGVDAPETRRSSRKELGYYGKESKEYLTGLLAGNEVRLEYDVDRHDRYGRLLAYVYLDDGTFINAELISNGFAMVMTVPPNVKHAEYLLQLQVKARKDNRGLWANSRP